jgi:hypothetical protein
MPMRKPLVTLVAVAGVVSAACAVDSGGDPITGVVDAGGGRLGQRAPASLLAYPQFTTIAVGGSATIVPMLRDRLGRPIAGGATFAVQDTVVARVSSGGVVTGTAAGTTRVLISYDTLSAAAWVRVLRVASGNVTPLALYAVVGPLIPRAAATVSDVLREYDARYQQNEAARFSDFLNCQNSCYLEANHYGGLRSRLMWALRNNEPVGAAATDEAVHMYARGRRVVQRYLQWSRSHGYAAKPENNTGLADVETLWLLDGDPEAYNHLWASAAQFSQQDKYIDLTGPATSPRQALVPLMALSAAHRLGIPFRRPTHISAVGFDGSTGSWKAAGERVIGWILAKEQADGGTGRIVSTAHGGKEAYLFNAWTAAELLRWCANVEWNQAAYDLARRIMDHLIEVYATEHVPLGWLTLPYTTGGTYAAHDLAGFYIWPSLALWRETGDARYYDFAMTNLRAANHAFVGSMKQFNQTYSMLGASAETLLSGAYWR